MKQRRWSHGAWAQALAGRVLLPGTLLLAGLLSIAVASHAAQPLGAFFTQVNTYVYADAPNQGTRVLLRPRLAYEVIDLTTDGEGLIWYKIIYPQRTRKVSGTGWIAASPHELLANPAENRRVLAQIPDRPDAAVDAVAVPGRDIKVLGITKPSEVFPQIVWQKVQYETNAPWTAWVRSATGIYRPGMSVAYMIEVYSTMVARNVPLEKLKRLLSGVVAVGDSAREVEWALGKPLRVRDEQSDNVRQSFWQYGALVVQFENAVVKQIN